MHPVERLHEQSKTRKDMTNTEIDIVERMRGLLPKNLYLGGSHALKKFFFDTPHIVPNDLDFFYYASRPMEKWVFLNSFRALGFDIVKIGINYDGKYKIPGQYWFIKGRYKDQEFDVIFIDPTRMFEGLGSTLAGIQYEISYGDSILSTPFGASGIDVTIRENMQEASVHRRVTADKEKCTDSQLEKIRERCSKLGLRLRVI